MKRRSLARSALGLTTLLLVLLCAVMTASRGGQIVCLVVLAAYFSRRAGLAGLLLGGLLALPLLLLGGRSGEEAVSSTLERMECWQEAIAMWREHPVLGVGLGQFVEHHYMTAHNSYLLAVAELGLPGMLLFEHHSVFVDQDSVCAASSHVFAERSTAAAPELRWPTHLGHGLARCVRRPATIGIFFSRSPTTTCSGFISDCLGRCTPRSIGTIRLSESVLGAGILRSYSASRSPSSSSSSCTRGGSWDEHSTSDHVRSWRSARGIADCACGLRAAWPPPQALGQTPRAYGTPPRLCLGPASSTCRAPALAVIVCCSTSQRWRGCGTPRSVEAKPSCTSRRAQMRRSASRSLRATRALNGPTPSRDWRSCGMRRASRATRSARSSISARCSTIAWSSVTTKAAQTSFSMTRAMACGPLAPTRRSPSTGCAAHRVWMMPSARAS